MDEADLQHALPLIADESPIRANDDPHLMAYRKEPSAPELRVAFPVAVGIGGSALRQPLNAVKVNLGVANSLKCRHGCDNPVVVVHAPEGCHVFRDPVQALCMQHLTSIESSGEITTLIDLRVGVA